MSSRSIRNPGIGSIGRELVTLTRPSFRAAARMNDAVLLPTDPLAGDKWCDRWNWRTAVYVSEPKWPVTATAYPSSESHV